MSVINYCRATFGFDEINSSACSVHGCGKISSSKRGLETHVLRMHSSVDLYWASKHEFLWCDLFMAPISFIFLDPPKIVERDNEVAPLRCPWPGCSGAFPNADNFKRHYSVDHERRPAKKSNKIKDSVSSEEAEGGKIGADESEYLGEIVAVSCLTPMISRRGLLGRGCVQHC